MLVLQRGHNEALILQLPDGRSIRVVQIRHGDKMKLGVEAPRDVAVLREELLTRDQALQSSAGHGSVCASRVPHAA